MSERLSNQPPDSVAGDGGETRRFRVSTRCDSGMCVGVEIDQARVSVTDMEDRKPVAGAPVIEFSPTAWMSFMGAVAAGDIAPPTA